MEFAWSRAAGCWKPEHEGPLEGSDDVRNTSRDINKVTPTRKKLLRKSPDPASKQTASTWLAWKHLWAENSKSTLQTKVQ